VRNRVESLVRALGLADGERVPDPELPPAQPDARRRILERLARREISAEEAAAQLRGSPVANEVAGD
jgi:hypothetical protein